MILFEDVHSKVHDAFVRLMRHPGLGGAVKHYQTAPGRAWQAAGLYTYIKREDRLVLEVLHSPRIDACAIRVYTEADGHIHYARKVVGSTDALPQRLEEASQTFLMQLPKKVIAAERFDPGQEFGAVVADVMLPLPPPVHIGSLEE
jgi:hypothetical protein